MAICDDKYRANYPRAYLAAHHPVLVLTVNGQPPAGWPKDSQEHKYDMGPYMISHAKFYSRISRFFRTATNHKFRGAWCVSNFATRKPYLVRLRRAGPMRRTPHVQAGYQIARQNCFRCHNAGREGGQKSGFPGRTLAAFAAASPKDFGGYVRNPAFEKRSGPDAG